MSNYYAHKVIVIAGGGSGIGRAIAARVSESAAAVFIVDKNVRAGKKVEQELREKSAVVSYVETDMTDINAVQRLLAITTTEQSIDIFFNCVGIVQGGEVKDVSLAHALDVTDTNLHATIIGTHVFYRHMVKRGRGQIVNFSSAAGLLPTPLMSFYTASKYGIVGFTHALRAEAASYGTKVNVVCPGFVRTPIYETAYYDYLDKDKTLDILFHKFPIQEPDAAAKKIVRGVARNRMTIHTWNTLYFAWLVYRMSPPLYVFIVKVGLRFMKPKLRKAA